MTSNRIALIKTDHIDVNPKGVFGVYDTACGIDNLSKYMHYTTFIKSIFIFTIILSIVFPKITF